MKTHEIVQVILYIIVLTGLTPVVGYYLFRVFDEKNPMRLPVLSWLEKIIYKLGKVDPLKESNWKHYTRDLILFNISGFLALFFLQMSQQWLPLNFQHLPNVTWHSSFNTAVSFMTNTNWQGYAGETTMSYLTQMAGLAVQNFVSAATGIAVLLALIRGIARKSTSFIGNFWVDLTRSTVFVLLPFSIILSVFLISQGTIQNFRNYVKVNTLEGTDQIIPQGPAASQIAIKQIGTNGGGFFNTNSAHPYENPTPFSNFIEMLSILLIPSALTFMYGKSIHSKRHGWTVFLIMLIMFVSGLSLSLYSEYSGNRVLDTHRNMEGKETRFGITNSVIWSVATTDASNGSVNSMHDSLSPIAGMVSMINIMLGEVIFGGVGVGLMGMILFIILTVFIAGLMVGRTPEYLGKKIEAFEVQMSILAILLPCFAILVTTAWASVSKQGLSGLNNSGPHGFSEILYAFTSAGGNNGSAFAWLNVNTVFYNVLLGVVMIIGRFGTIIPVLAMAGSLAEKKIIPGSAGTFRTDTLVFILLVIAVILIIAGLTFFPALSIGPISEHFLMNKGISF